ncbi:Uncharacterised protein [Acinetobacter baumannii]|nr:Uncharacterised protein [Acinetobacter baumannii]SSQ41929.1 Uncharacterised protein [Acinetobacter baumannii]SSS47648.1 Uncharacterised protein [Acinetobacter baumannii]SST06580.1 Uncharacterised protein [Acinetobacter baumannii]SSU35000.1 Uncharacterised protein [Acinetobacter baumannii]
MQHIAESGSAAVVDEFCSAQAVQYAVVQRFAAVVVGLGFAQVPVFFLCTFYIHRQ